MSLQNKISLFYAFLLINHLLHNYELYDRGLYKGITYLSTGFFLFAFLQIFLYSLLLYIGYQVFRHVLWGYRAAKVVAIVYLAYGIIFAVASVYREGNVPGNFTGFIFVMVSLPLLLQISDFLKITSEEQQTE